MIVFIEQFLNVKDLNKLIIFYRDVFGYNFE